jgi:hypothetical protein
MQHIGVKDSETAHKMLYSGYFDGYIRPDVAIDPILVLLAVRITLRNWARKSPRTGKWSIDKIDPD